MTWPTSRGFLNKPTDQSGTTHLDAREYDPSLGRFLSVDPVMDPTDPQQLNGYAYSNNSPITMSDPDGQFPGVPNWLKNAGKKVRNFGVGVGGGFTGIADSLWTIFPSSISFRPSGQPGSFMGGFPDMRLKYNRKPVVTPWLYKHTGTDANSKFTKAGEWASILIPIGGEAAASGKAPRLFERLGIGGAKDVAKSSKGWKLGDDVYAKTAAGNDPAWSTVRSRYWKNTAANPKLARQWDDTNLARMQRGKAPQRFNADKGGLESMELSHEPVPFRDGGTKFVPRWPQDHASVDPYRRPGY